MFGASALLKVFNVDYVIKLEKFNDKSDYMRVGNEDTQYLDILGLDIPTITLPVREGRSMAVIVESAVTNYRLREEGFNSAKEFENRVLEYIHAENAKRREEEE
jgi:HPr kinase/phosphorylase